jgi:membrane carboxypeptidase/penicillin-binding protein
VNLRTSSIRPAKEPAWLECLQRRLTAAAASTAATVTIHCGTWQHDLDQASVLADAAPRVQVRVHSVSSHRLALYLQSQRKLLPIIMEALSREAGVRYTAGVRLVNIL